MAYRIVYGPEPKMSEKGKRTPLRLQAMTAAFLLLFVLLVKQAWPDGTQMLRELLLPGEKTVTEEAFAEMILEMQAGEPMGEVFTAFCQEIIDHGTKLPD